MGATDGEERQAASPLLLLLERPIQRLLGKRTSCMVVCQWQKKHTS